MPNDGTAGDGQGNAGIFDNYLAEVPEDGRAAVEGYLKDAERHVNTRLQDAAELDKQLGAYREVDLSKFTPQQLGDVLGWYETISSDQDAFKQWLVDSAQEQGIALGGEEAASEDGFEVPQTKAELDAYVQQAVEGALKPFQEQTQATQEQVQLASLERQIITDFDRLETANNLKLTDEEKQAIVDLGEGVQGDNWIEEGFKRLQTIRGEAQTEFVQGRVAQPPAALRSGGEEGAKPVTDWNEATKMAVERLKQAHSVA